MVLTFDTHEQFVLGSNFLLTTPCLGTPSFISRSFPFGWSDSFRRSFLCWFGRRRRGSFTSCFSSWGLQERSQPLKVGRVLNLLSSRLNLYKMDWVFCFSITVETVGTSLLCCLLKPLIDRNSTDPFILPCEDTGRSESSTIAPTGAWKCNFPPFEETIRIDKRAWGWVIIFQKLLT